MVPRSIKRRLIRTKIRLNQTIQQILEINRNRKRLPYHQNAAVVKEDLEEKLKVLNRTAEQQAKLIKHYESQLDNVPNY